MTRINFNVSEFPKLCEEFSSQGYDNWITFLHDQGCKFNWQHYATKRKYVEMEEKDYVLFSLKWGS